MTPRLFAKSAYFTRLLIAIGIGSLAGCATTPERLPKIDKAKAEPIVAVVRYVSGEYLPKQKKCRSLDVICMDAPPIKLRAELLEQIYGPGLPKRLTLYTTSHFGLDVYSFPSRPTMALLLRDASTLVIQRNGEAELHQDTRGELAIPVQSFPIWWLPCDVMKASALVPAWKRPKDVELSEDFFEAYAVASNPDIYRVEGESAYPLQGLYPAAIKQALSNVPHSTKHFACSS